MSLLAVFVTPNWVVLAFLALVVIGLLAYFGRLLIKACSPWLDETFLARGEDEDLPDFEPPKPTLRVYKLDVDGE